MLFISPLTPALQRLSTTSSGDDGSKGSSIEGSKNALSSSTAEDTQRKESSPARTSDSDTLQAATFRLLLRADKRKHTLTKLQLDVKSADCENSMTRAPEDLHLVATPPSSQSPAHAEESHCTNTVSTSLPDIRYNWLPPPLIPSPLSSPAYDPLPEPYDVLHALGLDLQSDKGLAIDHVEDLPDDVALDYHVEVLDPFLPACGDYSLPGYALHTRPQDGACRHMNEDMETSHMPLSSHPTSVLPLVDFGMRQDILALISGEDDSMDIDCGTLDEVDAIMECLLEGQQLDELDALISIAMNESR